MEKKSNKFIAVSYKLYTIDADGTNTMVEEAPAAKPFQFISGFGITLDAFENALVDLEKGADFDFVLSEDEAYAVLGEHDILVKVDMGTGEASGKAWGCDLTYDYVKINGDYRT